METPRSITPVKFGKYLLLDPIGVGGMAEVFRAKILGASGFEKLVAVKKILPHLNDEKKMIQAFIHEARLAAYLQHDNIVRTFDFGKMGPDYFIAMEYLFGKNLRLIQEKARDLRFPMSLLNVLYVVSQVCIGLEHAHDLTDFTGTPLSIVHRDISPPNIFITFNGQVKVVDFGVAKAASRITSTQVGVIKGKVAYMSPEQARGEEVDHRTDIFALGAVLYELVIGKKLYSGETLEVLQKARDAVFEAPEKLMPDMHPRLLHILSTALSREPGDRYQSCGQMHADLEDCIFELSYRPSAKGLARYMGELFGDLIPEEEARLREVLVAGRGVGAGAAEEPVDRASDVTAVYAGEEEAGGKPCPSCGREVAPGALQCTGCGASLSFSSSLPAVEPAATAIRKKVCILGEAGSGKTSLLGRFLGKPFSEKYNPTVGASVERKILNFEGKRVQLVVWDLSGKDRFTDINRSDLAGMEGCLLTVDCTRAESLDTALALREELLRGNADPPTILVVTKTDNIQGWNVERKKLDELAASGLAVVRVSARTGVGVARAFMMLGEMMLHEKGKKSA
ncbi:MAG: protein kinase [Thermodesulfobacteriota bacterium]